jgi:hypothetical protein
MSSADINEIYEKLLEVYKVRYPYNPKEVLSYKISELVGEGKTRENAILTLYEGEGKITLKEAQKLGEAVKKEIEKDIEKQIKEHKKNIKKLTLLFSKGKLDEEAYKAAVKPLEEKIATLEREKKEAEIRELEEKLAKLKSEKREEETGKVAEALPEQKPEFYEGNFTLSQKFYKLLVSPSDAMKDIALAPDYGGITVIVVAEALLLFISVAIVLQKFHFYGPYADRISTMLSGILVLTTILAVGLFAVKWLIKSLIIKYACDGGSGWSFSAAASITGYAYLADVIFGILGICLSLFLIPSLSIDTEDFQAAVQVMDNYRSQITWLKLFYTLPVSFLALLWKSYLGGLGTHFGTEEKCSLGTGIAVFFVLGLLGLLISFIT